MVLGGLPPTRSIRIREVSVDLTSDPCREPPRFAAARAEPSPNILHQRLGGETPWEHCKKVAERFIYVFGVFVCIYNYIWYDMTWRDMTWYDMIYVVLYRWYIYIYNLMIYTWISRVRSDDLDPATKEPGYPDSSESRCFIVVVTIESRWACVYIHIYIYTLW